MIQTRNPATGEILNEYQSLSDQKIEEVLYLGHRAFFDWRDTTWLQRAQKFKALAVVLRANQSELARSITCEMGKPINEALQEVEKCATCCEYYGDQPEEWLADQMLLEKSPRVYVSPQPLGLILGIMPWNFPLWQVIRFATPTLLAGNTVILKHAPNTWGTALALAHCFKAAGFPLGVYQDFPIEVAASNKVIADARVRGVSLTGSTQAGRLVAEQAGRHLKRCVLELGGSDPCVILADADLDLAASKSIHSRMINAGQSCIAAKRLIVEEKVYDVFLAKIQDQLKDYIMGYPEQKTCKLGPLARQDLRDQLSEQVRQAQQQGANCILKIDNPAPNKNGFYYPATLLTEVTENSVAFKEELFGPVVTVVRAKDEKHAVRLANATSYGLGAAIFSRDSQRAERLARHELNAGLCVINGLVRSDPRWPFGGTKDSGYGRELTRYGAQEFVNLKTIVVD